MNKTTANYMYEKPDNYPVFPQGCCWLVYLLLLMSFVFLVDK